MVVTSEQFEMLEALYRDLNRRRYLRPDPLQFLHDYADPADREVVALLAGSLAYGRVRQILRSVSAVLAKLGPRPARHLAETTPSRLRRALAGFRHRFSTGGQVAAMLIGAKRVIAEFGSLEACFRNGLAPADKTVLPALKAFVARLTGASPAPCGHLLADPARRSACKRLNLMLRWLVRRDDVDPGGWEAVGAEKLIVPMDTHMHRIARAMGMTTRRSADLRAALETTAAFRQISPADPVRYDFALTRLGIRDEMRVADFLDGYAAKSEGKACA